MISAFSIYLVMQLDSIVGLFALAATGFGAAGVILTIFGYLGEEEKAVASSKRVLSAMALFAVLTALTPSSKTVAAMIVIPAIVNNEKVQANAGELYELAKAAMRDAVTDEKPEQPTNH